MWHGRDAAMGDAAGKPRQLRAGVGAALMICECGCGVELSAGLYKGRVRRFVRGHNAKGARRIPSPVAEDRGYATPCLIWQGKLMQNGYGRRDQTTAHRAEWLEKIGPIPAGLEPDHLCRVRSCVRLDHLELVTRAVNTRRGSIAKLTDAAVLAIRARYAAGADRRALAAEFGIAPCTVSNLAARRTWVRRTWVEI